jgi:multiple sugar transport system permease protein
MRLLLELAGRRPSAGPLLTYVVLTIMAAFFAVPIVWAIIEAVGVTAVQWLLNSIFYSGGGVVIAVALCVPAGYGLATHDFPGRRPLLIVTILMMLIPPSALVLPLFLEANAAHLLLSPLALILPYGLFPFGVYLTYLYFHTARFGALLESARIDGCNEWQAFRAIAVPLSVPVSALIVFLNFVASWTNFFLPWVMYWSFGTTSRYPLSLGIALQLNHSQTSGFYTAGLQLHTSSPPSQVALLVLLSAAPVVVVFVLAQRWIGSGQLHGMFR